jgi:hypothetical protein
LHACSSSSSSSSNVICLWQLQIAVMHTGHIMLSLTPPDRKALQAHAYSQAQPYCLFQLRKPVTSSCHSYQQTKGPASAHVQQQQQQQQRQLCVLAATGRDAHKSHHVVTHTTKQEGPASAYIQQQHNPACWRSAGMQGVARSCGILFLIPRGCCIWWLCANSGGCKLYDMGRQRQSKLSASVAIRSLLHTSHFMSAPGFVWHRCKHTNHQTLATSAHLALCGTIAKEQHYHCLSVYYCHQLP